MKIGKISDAEMEVMELFWQKRTPLEPTQVFELLGSKKDWKYSTVKTFLSRLVDKNLLSCEKRKINLYTPLISKKEYKRYETKEFLDHVHNGSLKSMLVSLCKEDISDERLEELIKKLK